MIFEKLWEWMFELMIVSIIIYVLRHRLRRLFRGKTSRDLEDRPKSFFQRIQPIVNRIDEVHDPEGQADLKDEALEAFAVGAREHHLPKDEFRLTFIVDDVEGEVAAIQRQADGRTWRLTDFDDFLLTRETA